MKVAKLQNIIQDFAWGSESYLPSLLSYDNPEGKPQAELWMGVHPRGESKVDMTPLSQYLLDESGSEYQGLPFLFKVLAAKQPLSIQAHPNKAQAEQGFAHENQLSIALDSPQRNYKDPNHKPEITLALSPFWAVCGFRPLDEIRKHFEAFIGPLPAASGHGEFFANLVNLSREQKSQFLERAVQNCSALQTKDETKEIARWVLRLAEAYPGDLGALAPLYLNLVCLQPGQVIYLPAGVLHAYLEGSAMELMANSDNVLRGGLTPKHQDIAELMRVLTFEEFSVNIIEARKMDLHRSYFPSTAAEFRLECWHLNPEDSALYLPQKHPVMIAFVYEGSMEINGIELQRGESCIIPASGGEVSAKALNGEQAIAYVAAAKET